VFVERRHEGLERVGRAEAQRVEDADVEGVVPGAVES
jgi:hypothetical protein